MYSLLSWNIGLNSVSASAPSDWDSNINLVELLKVIEEADPDLITLQEMKRPNFPQRFIDYNSVEPVESHSGYTTVFVRKEKFKILEVYHLPGSVLTKISHGENKFYFAGVHLLPYKENEQQRLYQIAQILLAIAQNEDLPVIIAGDMNLREAETSNLLKLDLKDAFLEVGAPKIHKFSWNSKINKHLKEAFEFTARFDRILVRNFNVDNFMLLGNVPVSENQTHYLSDHFAIYSELSDIATLEDEKEMKGSLEEFF